LETKERKSNLGATYLQFKSVYFKKGIEKPKRASSNTGRMGTVDKAYVQRNKV